jgi:TfoX/Sxy family transcriptional regulator of competence genes
MATDLSYMIYIVEKLEKYGNITYKKMFGEYMVYLNQKAILLVCDHTIYVKQKEELTLLMKDSNIGMPYPNAKPHFILDIDDQTLLENLIPLLEKITPLKTPKKK